MVREYGVASSRWIGRRGDRRPSKFFRMDALRISERRSRMPASISLVLKAISRSDSGLQATYSYERLRHMRPSPASLRDAVGKPELRGSDCSGILRQQRSCRRLCLPQREGRGQARELKQQAKRKKRFTRMPDWLNGAPKIVSRCLSASGRSQGFRYLALPTFEARPV